MSAKAFIETRINMAGIVSVLVVVRYVSRAESETIPLWRWFETQVENANRYANPFKDVELDATFTSPSGRGADPSGLQQPSGPAAGVSMIVSRKGGHNQPAPKDIEYYLPYQTSVIKSAGKGPTMIVATRKTRSANNMDLRRFWRNRNRRRGGQPAWYDWISNGAALIAGDNLP